VVAAVRTPASTDRAVTGALAGARAGRGVDHGADRAGKVVGAAGGDRSGAAGGDRSDAATAYRHAAQARADLDRAHVSAQLSRLGVRVVDAEPEHLAPALADAYLDLKAQGRL
jgi:uncharacterized protein (DUF58 family)